MTEAQETILIVEDSPVQATAIGHLLLGNGARVLYAPDGQAGVYIAQRYLPDVIILDLEMPKMNGLEACSRLKANPETADIPVLLLTQYADRADPMTTENRVGTIDFIPKDSFASTVLVETLRQMHILDIAGS
jgi:CheY-like chemotaxis protein